jgi:hypothetical protein
MTYVKLIALTVVETIAVAVVAFLLLIGQVASRRIVGLDL